MRAKGCIVGESHGTPSAVGHGLVYDHDRVRVAMVPPPVLRATVIDRFKRGIGDQVRVGGERFHSQATLAGLEGWFVDETGGLFAALELNVIHPNARGRTFRENTNRDRILIGLERAGHPLPAVRLAGKRKAELPVLPNADPRRSGVFRLDIARHRVSGAAFDPHCLHELTIDMRSSRTGIDKADGGFAASMFPIVHP